MPTGYASEAALEAVGVTDAALRAALWHTLTSSRPERQSDLRPLRRELARWFVAALKLDVECQVVPMEGWTPHAAPGYGWPIGSRTWINPSPNAPNLWMARCYPGSVMLEATWAWWCCTSTRSGKRSWAQCRDR